jgi:hypothetical protein
MAMQFAPDQPLPEAQNKKGRQENQKLLRAKEEKFEIHVSPFSLFLFFFFSFFR